MDSNDSSSSKGTLRLALLGNPNTGKTSIFNDLTGLRQRVGNYPGITVEKKMGFFEVESTPIELIDLPGTYSLAASSLDERVVVDMLAGKVPGNPPPEVIVFVADATNLLRNLFLASQVAELCIPMVIALNLMDSATKKGITINVAELSKRLGVPVIPTVATRDEGIDDLRSAVISASKSKPKFNPVDWPEAVNQAVETLSSGIQAGSSATLCPIEMRRLLFDANSAVGEHTHLPEERLKEIQAEARAQLTHAGYNPLAAEALIQYEYLGKLLEGVVHRIGETKHDQSESIDKLMIHRGWGLAIFIGMMFVGFQAVYSWAGPLMDVIDAAKVAVQGWIGPMLESTPTLQSLVNDGIIEGVGAFVIFLPQILILFLFIALLEDTGYMSRAAFLMDKLFHWCGLNGKSFVPMLSSYACAVPGVMATRTIEDPKARLITILLAPLMSCSARLPVYVLLIGAFVEPQYGSFIAGVTLFAMHFVGLAIAIPLSWLFTKFLVKTKAQPFLMEMPPYRVPRLKNVVHRMYEAGFEFVQRAGTVILAFTILIWAALYFPRPEQLVTNTTDSYLAEIQTAQQISEDDALRLIEDPESDESAELDNRIQGAYVNQSYLGRTGQAIQPVFELAGFDWKITVGVLASFPAREVIISTMGVVFSLGGDVDEESGSLRDALRKETWETGTRKEAPVFTLPTVFAIMIFFALCSQCSSTLAVIAKESNWKWAGFVFFYMTSLAWVAAVLTYQIGVALF